MFYRLYAGVIEQGREYLPAPEGVVGVGLVTREELQRLEETDGVFRTATSCFADASRAREGLTVYDDGAVGVLSVVRVGDLGGPRDDIGLVISRELLLFVDLSDLEQGEVLRPLEASLARMGQNPTPEKVLYGLLNTLLHGGDVLAATENRLMEFERLVSSGRIDDGMNRTIFSMRRRLAALSGYYEQLAGLGRRLSGNENDLFAPDGLRYFRLFAERADHLGRQASALLDSLVHLREAVDAALNTSINRVMKLFTVVTTIFSPLTLIVGWYGMNFHHMPEFSWRYGYPFAIGLCVTVVAVTVVLFRKKNLF